MKSPLQPMFLAGIACAIGLCVPAAAQARVPRVLPHGRPAILSAALRQASFQAHAFQIPASHANVAPTLAAARSLVPNPLSLTFPRQSVQEKTSLLQSLAMQPPVFEDMSVGEQKTAATDDFAARLLAGVGEGDGSPVEIIVDVPEIMGPVADIDRDQARHAWANHQMAGIGINPRDLGNFQADLVGAVGKINTVVFKVPQGKSQGFIEFLSAQGYGARLGQIIARPRPVFLAGKTVSLKDMSSLIRADRLQNELKKVLGEPARRIASEPGLLLRAVQRLKTRFSAALTGTRTENPDLPWALIDGYAWTLHPFLKNRFVKEMDNHNDRDIHGTHTGGTVISVDIFNYSGRVYDIFPYGSATEGDILLKINAAQKDGALATTNSWGDSLGDPKSPAARLFVQQAREGMHHNISAGNDGPDANSMGGPAIAYYNADLVINGRRIGQAKRIKAIAAADSSKDTADFSSRGPGSRLTKNLPEYKDYPAKPDEAGMGVNLVGPTPVGSHVAELGGPGQAMSGTSMSNPGVFGGFLLLTRGILVLLADYLPKLPEAELKVFAMDVARYAMTQTARQVAPAEEQGDGFVDVWEAYEFASKLLKSSSPFSPARFLRAGIRRILGFWVS